MEVSKIEDKLKELIGKKEKLRQLGREYEILAKYSGEDKVITSEDALDEINSENKDIFKCSSGYKHLDELIGDFRGGQVVILSAPTGQGKTTFLQSLTYNFAEQNVNCVWFSYEVGLKEFLDKMPNAPIFYLPRQMKQNNLEWLEIRIKESIAKYGCQVVCIDHLHYLIEMQKMAQAKSLSLLVGMMMRELKRIAIENEIVIFLVSHMRKVYLEGGKAPNIDDLRDSSFVGQESDMVMFLTRIVENNEVTNWTMLRVSKNRRLGNLGCIKLKFTHNRFYDEETARRIEESDKLPNLEQSVLGEEE